MPKIETPGMFRERIAENFIVGETGHLAFQEGGKERIDAMIAERDAAIRAESAERERNALKAQVDWQEYNAELLHRAETAERERGALKAQAAELEARLVTGWQDELRAAIVGKKEG